MLSWFFLGNAWVPVFITDSTHKCCKAVQIRSLQGLRPQAHLMLRARAGVAVTYCE
jgi:hypothetical protein